MRKLWLAFFLLSGFWLRPVLAQTEPPQTNPAQAAAPKETTGDLTEDSAVDAYALKAPPEVTQSVRTLANYFCQRVKTDRAKARAIFTWIDGNLAYDMNSYLNPNVRNYEERPEVILRSSDRTAVCGGHAALFEALAKAAGLEAVVISGYARQTKGISGKEIYTDTGYCYGGHAWNAVKIDGIWQLLDVTWANPHRKVGAKIEVDGTTDYNFFLIPPQQLIYTHFPAESRWQRLSKPLARLEQERLPMLTPAFFKYGGKVVSHSALLIKAKSNVCVTIGVDKDISVMDGLFQDDKALPEGNTFSQHTGRGFETYITAPKAGKYELHLFAVRRSPDKLEWSPIATYLLTIQEGSDAKYPAQYNCFLRSETFLLTPFTGLLDSATPQDFSITVPGATRVDVICGKEFFPLEKQGDEFVGKITVRPGDVKIGAEYPGRPNWYETLLVYQAK